MEVAIMTGLLAEGDMQVNTGHGSKVGKIPVQEKAGIPLQYPG